MPVRIAAAPARRAIYSIARPRASVSQSPISMTILPDRKIDCLGLACPMPILKTREAVRGLAPGQILEMISDDPASEADVRSWSAKTGHHLVAAERNGPVFRFLIRKT